MKRQAESRNAGIGAGLTAGLLFLFSVGFLGFRMSGSGALHIYFIRHAETMANVTGDKTEANNRTFSDRGKKQIAGLTEVLTGLHIDHVLVSPTYRTRFTVLPFLKKTGMQAEIWPELEEWRMKDQLPDGMTEDSLRIVIEPENHRYLRFRGDGSKKPYFTKNYKGGLIQIQKIHAMIQDRFHGTGETLLLVGHSDSGSRLLEQLSGQKMIARYQLKTARLNLLEETESGKYRIVMLNGERVKPEN